MFVSTGHFRNLQIVACLPTHPPPVQVELTGGENRRVEQSCEKNKEDKNYTRWWGRRGRRWGRVARRKPSYQQNKEDMSNMLGSVGQVGKSGGREKDGDEEKDEMFSSGSGLVKNTRIRLELRFAYQFGDAMAWQKLHLELPCTTQHRVQASAV